jgi:hypothetical protein
MSQLDEFDQPASFVPYGQIASRGMDWLWPGRLALGKLAILEGDPGLGKSYLALDLCARLSTGQPWPDGSATAGPAASVYLNAEDGAEDTLGPRLRALGADPASVYVLDRSADNLSAVLTLSAQMRTLEELLARVRPLLMVIDPISPFLDARVNLASDASVRRGLAPLADLAQRHGCAVLLVRHLNKYGRGRAVYRGLGSIGLVGACRSAWLVAQRAEEPGQRVLAQVKNNLAGRQPSLAFEMTQSEGGAATLRWLGEVADTADELLALKKRPGRKPEKRLCARMFLEDLLANGPMSAPAVWEKVKGEGFSVRTIERAKREADIESVQVMGEHRMVPYWVLPKQTLPPEIKPMFPQEESVRELRKKYLWESPLDQL